ncbi:MAG TPA: hypothetical protein VFO73_11790 [Candidatus Limnocylindrales bacterium]|nr:hypothetical protein [Candidatus Limnocylindrales bacterium]
MLTRRQLLKAGVLAGVATGVPIRWRGRSTVIAADGILDAQDIP